MMPWSKLALVSFVVAVAVDFVEKRMRVEVR